MVACQESRVQHPDRRKQDFQLDDNIGALGVTLTTEEIALLDAATELSPVYPNWFSKRCWIQSWRRPSGLPDNRFAVCWY